MYSPWVKKFFIPPAFEDEDKTRIAELLNIILLSFIAGTAIFGIAALVVAPDQVLRVVIIGLMILSELGVFFLMRRGHIRLASMLLSSMLWVIATLVTIAAGGLNAPGFTLYFITLLVAGLLLGWRFGVLCAGLSAFAGLTVLWAEINDILPSPLLTHTPVSIWIIQSLALVVTAMLVYLATNNLNGALTRTRKGQAQLMDAIESLTEAFALYDVDDRLVVCNTKYQEYYDLSADLLVPGVRFKDHIRASAYRGQIAEAVGREEAWVEERVKQHQNPQGVYLQQLCNGRWLQISERKTREGGIVGVRTDVTDRKLAEEALQESEERYRTLMEQLPISVEIYDPDGTMIDANKAWERVWGVKREVAVNKFNALHDPMIKKLGLFPHIEKAFRGESGEIEEVFYVAPDDPSQKRWLHTRYYSLKDFSGNIANVVVLNEDITERKEAEEALHFQKTLLECQIEATLDGVLVVSDEREWLIFNRRFIEMWGISPEVIATRSSEIALQSVLDQLVDPQQFLTSIEYLYQYPAEASQDEIVLKDGRVFERYSASVTSEDGVHYGRVWYYRDITERKQAEEALRESEKRLIAAQHIAKMGDFTWDVETGEVTWSEPLYDLLQYDKSETIDYAKVNAEIHHPDDLERVTQWLSDCITSGEAELTPNEYRLIRKDDTIIYIRTVGVIERGEGKAVKVFATVQDITKSKRAEKALRKSEEKYRLLFEKMMNGFALHEIVVNEMGKPVDYVFLEVNPAFEQFTGLKRNHLIGNKVTEVIPGIENDPADWIGRYGKVALTGREIHFDQYAEPLGKWYSVLAFSPQKGQFATIFGDITERKQAEEALKRSEEYFRSLIENALDIITILNSDGTIRYESPSIERVLGYKAEELVGQSAFDFVHPGDLPEVMNIFTKRSQIAGPAPPIEVRFRHKDGSWRILEIIGTNLLDDPVVAGIVVNSRDITERRQLEEQFRQVQKMDALGQLTAGIAHDFNNLLTAINGFAGLMQLQLPPDDPNQESVDKILNSGQRAANLVRQLLAFSRKQIVEPQTLNLNTTVAEMDKILRRVIGENIRLKTNLNPELWWVKIDPTQIEQIIVNLAVNARDAMPEGGRLTIETTNVLLDDDYVAHHLETQSGEHVLLAISDSGQGISEEAKAHIFEPFYTTKEQGKGTGLGLATVYGIVKQNGGHIQVYSEPEVGTTFKIYLPRAKEGSSSVSHKEFEAAIPSGNETILLVEDDAEVRNLVRRVLQAQGYTLLEAEEGQEALRLAANHIGPIHLLLTDVIMPGMNGNQLAEEMGQLRSGLKILFMSGYTDDAIVHHGILDQGINLLQKPFGPAALTHKVRDVLDG